MKLLKEVGTIMHSRNWKINGVTFQELLLVEDSHEKLQGNLLTYQSELKKITMEISTYSENKNYDNFKCNLFFLRLNS